jgi:putative oxidoreductase
MRTSFLIGRIIVGLFYLYSGLDGLINLNGKIGYAVSKGTPLPQVTVLISAVLLLIAGLTIITGYEVRIGVAALVLFFVPVTFYIHDFWNVREPMMRMLEMHSFQSNLALMASALMFLAIPAPWPYSLAQRIKQKQLA